jgi:Protein of unknown function (DUF3048) N-terminal domain/Protein of unknown function (DUF3048) C-terminal domain
MTSTRPITNRHRLASTVLAGGLLAVAAACSSGSDASTATTEAAPETTDPPTTTRKTTTTTSTTEATTTTTAAPTTTTEVVIPRMPLTGVPLAFGETAPARPALVVKIDNAPAARPQTGFNAADIVYEEIVNDSLTRFAMVFHSQGSDPVGPIRSGRIQDVDLFGSFHRPLFAWSGGNAAVTNAIRSSDLVELNQGAAGMFRQRGRRSPHNLYGTTTTFWEQAIPEQGPPPQQFAYRNDGEAPMGTPAAGVDVQLDSIRAHWTWDPAAGVYLREMNGAAHTDAATGEQISAQNVVVLEMSYLPGISGSPDAQSVGGGKAYVFTGGNMIEGNWLRPDRLDPFALFDANGVPIELTPGRTFIELPREGNTASF